MKINHQFDLTDDQLQQISGRKRNATRKEVKAWVDSLVQRAFRGPVLTTHPVVPADIVGPATSDFSTTSTLDRSKVCTNIDHIFPGRFLAPETGTPCYCGKRQWGEIGRRMLT